MRPALGRLFGAGDDTSANANPAVVLAYDFWRDHLGADPAVVGSTVSVNGQPFQVIGVAAPRFRSAIWGETAGCLCADVDDRSHSSGGRRSGCGITRTSGSTSWAD